MANLIEQMNILKGLSDEALQSEIHAPSGSAPPYLVMTELGRRKDMRQRYEGELARKKPQTTVLEDMTAGGMGAGGPPAPAMAPGGAGIGPTPQAMQAGPGFASGGIVDYTDIAKKYQDKLDGLTGQTDRARALALLAAGAGIMGGGHSNTLQNLGLGINAGVQSYQTAVEGIDQEELNLLRGITDIGQAQNQQDLADRQQAFQERQLAQDQSQFDARLGFDKKPASVVEWEYVNTLSPEMQKDYWDKHPPYNPNTATNQISDDFRIVRQQALDNLPVNPSEARNISKMSPQEQAAYQIERQKQADIVAYFTIKSTMGEQKAAQFQYQAGLTDAELLGGGGGSAPVVDQKDPFQLGL